MAYRVGINGFGRIGRNACKLCSTSIATIDVVAVNDLDQHDDAGASAQVRLRLTVFTRDGTVERARRIDIDGDEVTSNPAEQGPERAALGRAGRRTGHRDRPATSPTAKAQAEMHITAGAKKVHHVRAGQGCRRPHDCRWA